MVSVMSLWMPILVAAVAVFLASSLVHMVLKYHNSDFRKVPDEPAARSAMGALNLEPGDYIVPFGGGSESMKDPAFVEKFNAGPNVVMTVLPKGMTNMGALLGQWFVFCVVVSLFAAYVAGVTLAPGTEYLRVFRVAGTVAFVGYALGYWPMTIWYRKSTSATIKSTFDGFLYGLVTGGVFGWLWPA